MVIGIWAGASKPPLAEFLHPLINELKTILHDGIYLSSRHINIRMGKIICDTPARAFVKGSFVFLCLSLIFFFKFQLKINLLTYRNSNVQS